MKALCSGHMRDQFIEALERYTLEVGMGNYEKRHHSGRYVAGDRTSTTGGLQPGVPSTTEQR